MIGIIENSIMVNTTTPLDPPYLDQEERQIMQAFDRGEFQLSPDQARARREHQAAAKATLSNLRVAEAKASVTDASPSERL